MIGSLKRSIGADHSAVTKIAFFSFS